jgi:signal peptidase I
VSCTLLFFFKNSSFKTKPALNGNLVTCLGSDEVSGSKKIWENRYVKVAVALGLVVGIVLGIWVCLMLALNTSTPVLVVESGSMCLAEGGCDGLSHFFDPTLHVGDLIFIQNVPAEELNSDYPNSDIIVFGNPGVHGNPYAITLVHRIVGKEEINGTLYFQTKGDGNGDKWPAFPPLTQYDSHSIWTGGIGVPENLVLGKVILRIPLVGRVSLLLRDNQWGLFLVIAVLALLIALESVGSMIKKRRQPKRSSDVSRRS